MAKVPLLRLWMRYIHCLFLDRSNVKEGLKTILAGVDELKNGHSIWIFPEGTRNRGEEGSMLEFKEGSLKMADKVDVLLFLLQSRTQQMFWKITFHSSAVLRSQFVLVSRLT